MPSLARTGVLAASVFALLIVNGCASREDREFRAQVPSVLRLATGLQRATDIIDESDPEARKSRLTWVRQVETYLAVVDRLPQPKDKRLRYLAIRLHNLGDQASATLIWNGNVLGARRSLAWKALENIDRSVEDMRAWRPAEATVLDSAWAGRQRSIESFWTAYRVLVAAERVCLGTAWLRPLRQDVRREDSLNALDERFVREEVARLR